jgi:uncharacterized protein
MKTGSAVPASLVAAIAITAGGMAQAFAPPIKCQKAKSTVDRAVCESPEYVAMDREIAALYDRGKAQFTPEDRQRLAQSQLGFLKRRNGCAWASHHSAHPGVAVDECIRSVMEDRVKVMRTVVDRGGFARR